MVRPDDEQMAWLTETWDFMKKIFPLLFIGIFVAGVLTALLPENILGTYLGENTVFANLVAVLFGTFMYFPTLVEMPMAKMFLDLGMARGRCSRTSSPTRSSRSPASSSSGSSWGRSRPSSTWS